MALHPARTSGARCRNLLQCVQHPLAGGVSFDSSLSCSTTISVGYVSSGKQDMSQGGNKRSCCNPLIRAVYSSLNITGHANTTPAGLQVDTCEGHRLTSKNLELFFDSDHLCGNCVLPINRRNNGLCKSTLEEEELSRRRAWKGGSVCTHRIFFGNYERGMPAAERRRGRGR